MISDKILYTYQNVTTYTIYASDLIKVLSNLDIQKPICQGSEIENYILLMVDSFMTEPKSFLCKNKLVIANMNNINFLIDGQHRIKMIETLIEKEFIDSFSDFPFEICYYYVSNKKELYKLFASLNHDSKKNSYFVNEILDKKQTEWYENLIVKLKENHSNDFNKTKSSKPFHQKCIEEFVTDLSKRFKSKVNYDILLKYNKEFYDHIENNFLVNGSNYYKSDIKALQSKIVFTSKKNNFLDYLESRINENASLKVIPMYTLRPVKTKISIKLRKQVFQKEFGIMKEGLCPISFCHNKISIDKDSKYNKNLQIGHIKSEYNGGKTIVDNLRPICSECNASMNYQNWNEYDVKSQ